MFILQLIRYLRGYVRFQAQGGFVERFLNLIAREHISVWNGQKRGDVYTGCVSAREYAKLRASARKAGVHLRVSEKQGFPFRRRKYRKRTGLVTGLAFFFVFLFAMSQFIWRIEVHGNETVADSKIISALEDVGVHTGSLRAGIDVRDSERRALLLLHELSWIALNIEGSTIYVEVNESVEPPEMVDPNAPCNIVAAEAGQILSMQVYEGQPLLTVGDTVLPGDVIVSGITRDSAGQNLFRHARADILAQVQYNITATVPLNQTQYTETGKTRLRRWFNVFGLELPFFLPLEVPQPYRVDRETTPLTSLVPANSLSLLKENYILMEAVPVTLSEDEAKALAERELDAMQQAELAGAEILDMSVNGKLEGDNFVLQADYVCIINIATEKEIRQTQ